MDCDQIIVLFVAPFKVIPPPSAVISVGLATDPSSIFLSSTVTVVELTVVVVPLTVRFPPIVTSFAVVTLPNPSTLNLMSEDPAPPICTIAFAEVLFVCTRIPFALAPGAETSRRYPSGSLPIPTLPEESMFNAPFAGVADPSVMKCSLSELWS